MDDDGTPYASSLAAAASTTNVNTLAAAAIPEDDLTLTGSEGKKIHYLGASTSLCLGSPNH